MEASGDRDRFGWAGHAGDCDDVNFVIACTALVHSGRTCQQFSISLALYQADIEQIILILSLYQISSICLLITVL